MSETIKDGTGTGNQARVTSDHRILTDSLVEDVAAVQSAKGLLFGCGTGNLSVLATMSLGPVLWLKNNDPDHFFYISKLIFGYNGGNTNHDRTVLSLIKYQSTIPTGANSDASPGIENISKSGSSAAVTDSGALAEKWDGMGTGMTGSSGGFFQIPNRLAKGNTSIPIGGEIILGQNDTMSINITPEEDGEFNAAIVYYKVPIAGRL